MQRVHKHQHDKVPLLWCAGGSGRARRGKGTAANQSSRRFGGADLYALVVNTNSLLGNGYLLLHLSQAGFVYWLGVFRMGAGASSPTCTRNLSVAPIERRDQYDSGSQEGQTQSDNLIGSLGAGFSSYADNLIRRSPGSVWSNQQGGFTKSTGRDYRDHRATCRCRNWALACPAQVIRFELNLVSCV